MSIACDLTRRTEMTQLPKLVFVLDDDEGFQQAAIRLLRISGIAATGARNMNGLREAFPLPLGTCILVDIMLLGESGLEVPTLLAAHGQSAPVVFITAIDDEEKMQQATRLSGIRCLSKPVEVAELCAVLSSAMLRFATESGE